MLCFRFLLSYEKYLKNLGPNHVEEMDEKTEKTFEEEEKTKTSNGTNGDKTSEEVEELEEKTEEKEPVVEQKPKIGIKSFALLTDPESVAKSESMDEGKIKIDDLIIIPNNINHAEEGGSALQVNRVENMKIDKDKEEIKGDN